jgi:serine/threonine-protein kinase
MSAPAWALFRLALQSGHLQLTLIPGTRVGPYEIIAQLGAGGMGEVYRATDTNLKRQVAIKVLPASAGVDAARLARFQREAEILAALNHPNIAHIHGLEQSDGTIALVMELVEGQSLADRIASGAIPIDEALPIAKQIAEALEAAHQQGIIHRDLKPANIKVRPDGTAKLLDFGLARSGVLSDADAASTAIGMTQPGMLLGTAAYMAPEQARGEPADARTDIFSFGAVLYEMLSGKRTFGGASAAEVMSAVLRDEPAAIDSPASAIVTRCLAKRPAARYQTMPELKAALNEVTRQPTASRKPSIAVLPFANMSREPDDEYFSDGLAEEIINLLTQIPGLKVIARTSSFAFRGKEQDITKIAEALRVNTILEGSVRRAGNRIRVTAQLISAEDGSHLFSERYDREMTDVFAMQDDIAAGITAALRMKLTVQPAEPRLYTPSIPAYEAVLKARHHFFKLTPDALAAGRVCLEEAIALDPGYALPHAELGRYYIGLAAVGQMPAHDALPRARTLARTAISLDPSLPEALSLLASIAAEYEYDWKEAERLFDAARSRVSAPLLTRIPYGVFLSSLGRHDQAVQEAERAIADDPLNVLFKVMLMVSLLNARRFSASAIHARGLLELNDRSGLTWLFLSIASMMQGDITEGAVAAERAVALMPWHPEIQAHHAGLLARSGDDSAAERMLGRLGDGQGYGAPAALLHYFMARGDIDPAADWAAKAIEQRWPQIVLILQTYAGELCRSSRWPELLTMINSPDPGLLALRPVDLK